MSTLPAPTLTQTVERIKNDITADILDGTLPADVADFSTLHDYVDANCYGGMCDDGFSDRFGDGDEGNDAWMRHCDAAQEAIHQWLVAGRPGVTVTLTAAAYTLLTDLLSVNDDLEDSYDVPAEDADELWGAVMSRLDAAEDVKTALLAARKPEPEQTAPTDRFVALEAVCDRCGETFNPDGPDDLVHLSRVDDTDCGGLGELTGGWM